MNRLVALSIALPIAIAFLAGCPNSGGGGDGEQDPQTGVTDPKELKAPLQGQGFQMRTPVFVVGPGEEVQDCHFYKVRDLAKAGGLPENEPVNLHRIQMVQKDGSHHMNLFRVRTIKNLDPNKGFVHGLNGQSECFKSPNWSDWPLVANTQQDGQVDWTFPDGVANVFEPDEWIMLQTHYVNAGSQKTPEGAEVAINWYTMPKDKVVHQMGTLFATKQSIRVCKTNPTPEFFGTCQFKNAKSDINIIGANGHFHGRGKTFDMYSWDGVSIPKPPDDARFYRSESWDDPPMKRSPELNTIVKPGGGVYFSCGFQWRPPAEEMGGCKALDDLDKSAEKDCCYTFGPIVEKNEHCNAFVYYWPKQETGDIFCN
jgi:hypothetical protein